MKVEVYNLTQEAQERRDYCDYLEIKIDNKRVFSVHDGEREDNNLCRNFSDCYSIPDLLKRAYEAGRNGEEFSVSYFEVD
jgi:hypothetical protein